MKVYRNRAKGDSGAISAFRPSQKTKPVGFLARFQQAVERFLNPIDPDLTSAQGAAGTSAPSTYFQTLWAQRYEKAAYIADCNEVYLEDGRVKKSVDMYVREAVRGGFKIKIEGGAGLSSKAQKLADSMVDFAPSDLLEEWGRNLLIEGDLFAQMVCTEKDLVKIVSMPAAGMERLSDDSDEIIDTKRAFSQVDTQTWSDIAYFSAALMTQVRWTHRSGNRYGTPELIAVRRPWRILKLLEESMAIRSMTRAALVRHHKVGDPASGNPGTKTDLDNYKAENGFVEGKREVWDPIEAARDIFSNGLVTIENLEGDMNLDKIDGIRYAQNVLGCVLPTPLILMSNDVESVNRDVFKDVMRLWLQSTVRLNEALDVVLRFAFDLRLILNGIDPDLIQYNVIWTTSNIETPSEEISSTVAQRGAKLISRRAAVTKLAQHNGVEDVDSELKELDGEDEAEQAQHLDTTAEEAKIAAKATNGKPTNGKAKKDDILALVN